MGCVNHYGSFIPTLADLSAPLNRLLKNLWAKDRNSRRRFNPTSALRPSWPPTHMKLRADERTKWGMLTARRDFQLDSTNNSTTSKVAASPPKSSNYPRFRDGNDFKVKVKIKSNRNSYRGNTVESVEVHPNGIPPKWPDCRRIVVLQATQQPGWSHVVWSTCSQSDYSPINCSHKTNYTTDMLESSA